MNRWLKQGLSLLSLKKTLTFGEVFSATKFDFHIGTAKPDCKNVLVLSPHPDDDAFGMGGTIKKITSSGGKVTVAYFCDGSGGVPEGRPEAEEMGAKPLRDENLIEIRKREAEEAKNILGISELVFWGYPDGKLAAGSAAVKALQDLIKRVKPDTIFLPSFLDNHGDHRVVNEIFINAAAKLPEAQNVEVWAYEIWTPIYVNRLVDISLYIKTKSEAVRAHQSQIASRGYDKAILGLNQYRAEINKTSGFAEGFFAAPFEIYKTLYRKS